MYLSFWHILIKDTYRKWTNGTKVANLAHGHRQEGRKTLLMLMLTSDICVFLCAGGGFHMYVLTACWYKLLSHFFTQQNWGYLPPPLSVMFFLGQQADQISPLPPAPIPPPTHSLLPHVLLSVNVPIILHASLFSFSRPFVLLMLRPHRHPGPVYPRWLAMAPCAAGCGTNWMLLFLMHSSLAESDRQGGNTCCELM